MKTFLTDCDYCGRISLCFEDEWHGTCCSSCSKKKDSLEEIEAEVLSMQDLFSGAEEAD